MHSWYSNARTNEILRIWPKSLINPTKLTCEVKIAQALQGLH